MTLIFVYGTLKRGDKNHHYLAGQTFVGPAWTVPGFRLYDLGDYPGMVESEGDQHGVAGEVWSVDPECLARLDLLEGVSVGLYRRGPVRLREPFADRSVDAYYFLHPTAGCTDLGSRWDCGNPTADR